ncbi:MAG TPA: hypothetical protein VGX23_19115 [Actinocrinis sp.]|nr:hypothetical protein [Actinocrinis sp.]
MAEEAGSASERVRRIWEIWVPVGLGVLLALLEAFHVMNSDYAAAAVLFVLGLIGFSQIGRDRQSADQFTGLRTELQRQLSAVHQALDGVSELQFYEHHELFYLALARQVSQAKTEVLTSYLRRYPPEALNSQAVSAYFAACVKWVTADSTHQFRRVVTSEAMPQMDSWKDSQRKLALKHLNRYLVRVVDVRGDAMSIAIIDQDQVFFAFGSDPYVVTGFSLRSAKLGKFMREYHHSLWNSGRDITTPQP